MEVASPDHPRLPSGPLLGRQAILLRHRPTPPSSISAPPLGWICRRELIYVVAFSAARGSVTCGEELVNAASARSDSAPAIAPPPPLGRRELVHTAAFSALRRLHLGSPASRRYLRLASGPLLPDPRGLRLLALVSASPETIGRTWIRSSSSPHLHLTGSGGIRSLSSPAALESRGSGRRAASPAAPFPCLRPAGSYFARYRFPVVASPARHTQVSSVMLCLAGLVGHLAGLVELLLPCCC